MKKAILLTFHSLPLVLGILLAYWFWQSNSLLLFLFAIITIVIILKGRDIKTELWVFLYGLISGFIIETIGTQISGYQSFTKPEVFGIPYWLLIAWGYGFILMKRLSLIIGTGSPWIKNK